MLDVRIPHVHAPHGELSGWRSFATHVAIVVIGLLLALCLEQGAEYVHHRYERARLEIEMRDTFQSNLVRADKNIKVLDTFRTYLIDLRAAVAARIRGETVAAPSATDPRNFPYSPPPNLGSFEASKLNGSVSLLSLDRIGLFDRIEFQHTLMMRTFHDFFDSLNELRSFADRFDGAPNSTGFDIPQPPITELSPAQLVEYQRLIGNAIQNSRAYAIQLGNLKVSYGLMLNGVNDADALMDALNNRKRDSR